MFDFGPYSVELFGADANAILLDYSSFNDAEEHAREFLTNNEATMVNIIQWDASKRRSVNEWCVVSTLPCTVFEPSKTLH